MVYLDPKEPTFLGFLVMISLYESLKTWVIVQVWLMGFGPGVQGLIANIVPLGFLSRTIYYKGAQHHSISD